MINDFKQYYERTLRTADGQPTICEYADVWGVYTITDGGDVMYAECSDNPADGLNRTCIKALRLNGVLHWEITHAHFLQDCSWYVQLLCSRHAVITTPQNLRHCTKVFTLQDVQRLAQRLSASPLAQIVIDAVCADIHRWPDTLKHDLTDARWAYTALQQLIAQHDKKKY